MKKIFFISLLIIAGYKAFSQISFDFEDNDLSHWEQWPENHWTIESSADNNNLLKHSFDNDQSGEATISVLTNLDLSSAETTWKFHIQHGYSPSTSNLWAVFLATDATGKYFLTNNDANGYAIGVNLKTNNDLLSFYRIDKGIYTTLITTSFNWQEEAGIDKVTELIIKRDVSGKWEVFVNCNIMENILEKTGEVIDNSYKSSLYFTVYYKYTSSQDIKLWFDNLEISGEVIIDKISPKVTDLFVLNDSILEIIFSEPIRLSENGNCFTLNGIMKPDSIIIKNTTQINLLFTKKFSTTNEIRIQDIPDISDNFIKDTTIYFYWYKPVIYDLLITEVMSSPTPSLGLPGKEYIEIFNHSEYKICANNWEICINQKCKPVNFKIEPNYFVIICDLADTGYFTQYGQVTGVSGLNSLPNDGAVIELKNENKQTIHYISYSNKMHSSVYKEEGGWSLEIIDTKYPCIEQGNWTSSNSISGGSPGKVNSVAASNPDYENPSLNRVSVLSDNSIRLHFSENMSVPDLYYTETYELEDNNIRDLSSFWPGNSSVIIDLEKSLKENLIYNIGINKNMKDCAGNLIDKNYAPFALPAFPDSGSIIINEILFNPGNLGTEFIEIYNRGKYTYDLDNIRFAIREDYTGELKNITEVNEPGHLLFPEDYFVITNNAYNLNKEYVVKFPGNVHENILPAMNDEEESLVLCDQNLNIIDMVRYSASWHHPLLNSNDGISLERIDPEKSALLQTNWHSASSTSGYATPGYQNSQSLPETIQDKTLIIEPEIFSPDNDGYNDLLKIELNPDKEGYLALIKIFDAKGRMIRFLVNNSILGLQNTFTWDGTNENNELQTIGIYIVFVNLFNMKGESVEFKKTCVLGGKINQ